MSTAFKVFESLVRIPPIIEKALSVEQVRFRKNGNCCDPVLVLTTHVKNDFQGQEIPKIVFLDLSFTYDTV